jgi:hypothetical protein
LSGTHLAGLKSSEYTVNPKLRVPDDPSLAKAHPAMAAPATGKDKIKQVTYFRREAD